MRFSLVLLTIRRILWDILQGSHKITRRPCDIRSIENEVSLRNIKMFGVRLVLSCTEERKAIVNNGKCLSQSSLSSLTNIANICCKVLLKRSIIPSDLGWMGVFLYFFHFIRLKKKWLEFAPLICMDSWGWAISAFKFTYQFVKDSLCRVVWKSLCLCPLR